MEQRSPLRFPAVAGGMALTAFLVMSGTATASATGATAGATVGLTNNDLTLLYSAGPGQTNHVQVTESSTLPNATPANVITFVIDDVVPVAAGKGCVHPDAKDLTRVNCTVIGQDPLDPYGVFLANLGDGNDTFQLNGLTNPLYYYNTVNGGTGNDTITVSGLQSGDYVYGNSGNDTLTSTSNDATSFFGGPGNDTLTAPGNYSLLEGSSGNDVLQGLGGDQTLFGGTGNDLILGGTGDDTLYGGKGDDTLYGNSGSDTLSGNSGNDKLYGGPGKDTLSGGPGRNLVHQD